MDFYEAIKKRRSRYDITNKSPISKGRIEEILAGLITLTPSAFNSQSSRAVLLFEEEHKKLWSIVTEVLRQKVTPEKFSITQEKINSFGSGFGTILFFEDMEIVEAMQKNVPTYSENFPIWSMQSGGMLQFAVWTALSQEGLGASIQHYNPIIDSRVQDSFNIPPRWKLLAQMPFGTAQGEPALPEHRPIEGRLFVKGGSV